MLGAVRADKDFILLRWVVGNLGFRIVTKFFTVNYGPIVRMGGRGL